MLVSFLLLRHRRALDGLIPLGNIKFSLFMFQKWNIIQIKLLMNLNMHAFTCLSGWTTGKREPLMVLVDNFEV
ncbi:hypothetical protein Peur_037523 [Populus x canadensis]